MAIVRRQQLVALTWTYQPGQNRIGDRNLAEAIGSAVCVTLWRLELQLMNSVCDLTAVNAQSFPA